MQPVLVVEDDRETRELLASCLKHKGIPVITASNGKEGLERLAREEPSVVLLDLMMPVMDGEQFRLAQLRDSRLSAIPTILVSAVHDAAERAKQLGLGLLPKPFDLDQLVWVVRSIIRGRPSAQAPSPQH
jgi:DNA-binding response OmpR family regulator